MQLAKYFNNLPERFGVRLVETKILRDLTTIICPIDLIPQQINISEFTVKNQKLFKIYILIFRIQNLITSGNKIIELTNDMTDEI
jgi:hypothetical protein